MAKPKKRPKKEAAAKPNTVLDRKDNGTIKDTPDNVIKVIDRNAHIITDVFKAVPRGVVYYSWRASIDLFYGIFYPVY